jgi:hypothetical protein
MEEQPQTAPSAPGPMQIDQSLIEHPHHIGVAMVAILVSIALSTLLSVGLTQLMLQKTIDERLANAPNEGALVAREVEQSLNAKLASLDNQLQELKAEVDSLKPSPLAVLEKGNFRVEYPKEMTAEAMTSAPEGGNSFWRISNENGWIDIESSGQGEERPIGYSGEEPTDEAFIQESKVIEGTNGSVIAYLAYKTGDDATRDALREIRDSIVIK